jgi:coniferyl-aldehyde dehydrogenase
VIIGRTLQGAIVGVVPLGISILRDVLHENRVDAAIALISARPRPLALYWFGADVAAQKRVLQGTVSGGVTVNDTLMHVAHEGLPFGGVGDSGLGAYHGETGFLRFTHCKSVFVQSRWSLGHWLYPPYGARFQHMMGMLRRLLTY